MYKDELHKELVCFICNLSKSGIISLYVTK